MNYVSPKMSVRKSSMVCQDSCSVC